MGEEKKIEYIASCSGGKDSVATVILAHEHNEPLDEVIFSEVMFSRSISGELPEHIDFIRNVLFPRFEEWGYKATILRSDLTYLDEFFHYNVKGKTAGKMRGFPMSGKCIVNRDCKMPPIKNYLKGRNYHQYIGIASDEPKRLARLTDSQTSLLAKYGYTESMAKDLCIKYGLLSPTYQFAPRGGCWFCPNAREREIKNLYENHRDLIQILSKLEEMPNLAGTMWNTLEKKRIADKYEDLCCCEAQMTIYDFIDKGA